MYTLVLNPGSTSTKIAIYEDETVLCSKSLSHSKEELGQFDTLLDQLDFRKQLVLQFIDEVGFDMHLLNCIVSRGGSPPNVLAGATTIDENLVIALRERPKEPHPASLGPIIAYDISQQWNIPAYIYDPITADELNPLAKQFGVKGIEHDSLTHLLNCRAKGISVAKELNKPFESLNLIIVHIGGGNSVTCWEKGHPVDLFPTDYGTFSAERCGSVRLERAVALCKEHGFDEVMKWCHGKGGMVSLLGTNDLREVEKMIQKGDAFALHCQQAMAYQLAKLISALFPVVEGQIDGIVLTGGGAYWDRLVNDIKSRLAYSNVPFFVRPGEHEMQALAEGALRVMNGEERVHTYAS